MINILMFGGIFLIFLGFPASIIVGIVFKIKKKKALIPVICIPTSLVAGLIFIVIGSNLYSQTDEYKESIAKKEQSKLEQLKEEAKEQEKYIKELEKKINNLEQKKEEKVITENSENQEIIPEVEQTDEETTTEEVNSIFYGEIGLNEEYYKGKEVVFSFKVENYSDKEIEKITTGSNLCYGSVSVEFSEPIYISDGSYITVKGTLQKEHGSKVLKDVEILVNGTEAEENYQKEYEKWKNSFLQAEEVDYDELLRYPDTYKNKKVKVNANIKEVETDGVIFNGTISGVVSGTDNEIAFYDYRENREPRIKDGDKLTIYGVGNGAITVKLKNGKGLFAETVEEYDIPNIYIQFFDFR